MPVLELDNKKSSKADEQRIAQAEKRLADMFSSIKIPIIPKLESMTVSRLRSYQEILLEEQNDLLARLIKQQERTPPKTLPLYEYDHETKTFILRESRLSAVNFSAKSGNDDMADFFRVFYDCLKERGFIQKNYEVVFVSVHEIIKRLGQIGKNVDMNWIKNTRSNIVNHKIPQLLGSSLVISEFDRKSKGYYLKIKINSFDPGIN